MDLTDEQWALIQPLIPPPSPYARGRPPADPRATLDGILRKLRLSAPWYDLPPCAGDYYPSWQTCYRRYRRWQRAGLMDRIYRLLYQDLCDRAGIDLFKLLQVAGNSAQGPNSPLGQGAGLHDPPVSPGHPCSSQAESLPPIQSHINNSILHLKVFFSRSMQVECLGSSFRFESHC
jgi:transposase